MKLPNTDSAVLPSVKVRDYLLSPTHPIGRYKAAFFRSLGYNQNRWERLGDDLRTLLSNDAELAEETEFGKKYTTRGPISGPNGTTAEIVAVWIILKGQNAPRLVTAYPKD